MPKTTASKSDNLNQFIAHARSKGMDHATIRALLVSSGWKEKDVITALADESLSMAIPTPPDVGGPRDAFFHLLTSVCLYAGFFAIVNLFFDLLNRLFPDQELERWVPDAGGVRWFMATIIITAPLYFLLMRALNRDMQHSPEKAGSPIRRWLTYLTLFLASMTMVGNLITLVFYTLDGDLTIRFLCKVGVLFVLSGLVFMYYFASLRRPVADRSLNLSFRIVGIAMVLLALVSGFVVTGSPGARRAERLDEQRLSDVQNIINTVDSIAHDGQWDVPRSQLPVKPLPATLEEVQKLGSIDSVSTRDPETGVPYEYIVVSPTRFSVCAVFALERKETFNEDWNHPAGYHCFTQDITQMPGRF